MSAVRVRGLHAAFGRTRALDGVDLDVAEGSLAGVLGPSGCGKTTLLRVLAGFVTPDAGEVEIGGRTVTGPGVHVPPERRGVGIVPQEGALFPHLSVGRNVGFGLPRRAGRTRVRELLDLVGLGGAEDRMPAELSGGQQQRVALARALAPEPAVVLLDEPFSALDTGLRASLREDVRAAIRASGATALLVTHDQQEAMSTSDVVAVMREGRVVQVASPAELYACPVDLWVARFVGEAVVLAARAHAGLADTVLGALSVAAGAGGSGTGSGTGSAVLRPEQVVLARVGEGRPARVLSASYFGHDALVDLAVADGAGDDTRVTARTAGTAVPEPGTAVGVRVEGAALFFPARVRRAVTSQGGDVRGR